MKIREEVLEAEQHLLRIIDFDTRNEQKIGFIMLMCYLQYLECRSPVTSGSPQACQLAFTVYNDLVYLQITTRNHRSYPEYFRKARELVWAAIRASFLLGTELEGIAYPKKVDNGMIEKFKIDSKKIDCRPQ